MTARLGNKVPLHFAVIWRKVPLRFAVFLNKIPLYFVSLYSNMLDL